MLFLHSPAYSGSQGAETEIPVVQSLYLDDNEEEVEKIEEKRSEEEQQQDEEEDREAPPPPAPSSSPQHTPDQSGSTNAAGTTKVEPEPNKNLIELETAEEKNIKTLEVT